MTSAPENLDPDLLAPHLDSMRAAGQRLRRLRVAGQDVWIKLATRKPLRVQLTKGEPRRLLAHETALLRAMAARGAPVPPVLAAGEDHLVLADRGQALDAALGLRPSGGETLMAATGAALARMHQLGCTHGRPYIRDILVTPDGQITFADLERGGRLDAGPHFHHRDVAALVLSVFARFPHGRARALGQAAVAAYVARAPAGAGARLARFARNWRWLAVLTAPARYRERYYKPDKPWKEYQALPPTLDLLAGLGADG